MLLYYKLFRCSEALFDSGSAHFTPFHHNTVSLLSGENGNVSNPICSKKGPQLLQMNCVCDDDKDWNLRLLKNGYFCYGVCWWIVLNIFVCVYCRYYFPIILIKTPDNQTIENWLIDPLLWLLKTKSNLIWFRSNSVSFSSMLIDYNLRIRNLIVWIEHNLSHSVFIFMFIPIYIKYLNYILIIIILSQNFEWKKQGWRQICNWIFNDKELCIW